MKVVVTGGAGYVGTVLVPHLLSEGFDVHVVDALRFGGEALLPNFIHPRFAFTEGDVCDAPLMKRVLADADAVVHLAALVGYPVCKKFPEEARRTNVEGTQVVLDSLRPEARLINFSTGSNYGEVVGICDEDTPLNPLSLYGETKTRAEQMCMSRPNTVALRFATAFGLSPRLRLDLMINDFTYQALVNRYLLVYERHFRRTFIHVRDMARVVPHLLRNWDAAKDQRLNVGHESMNLTKEDIVNLLRTKMDFHLYFADVGKDEDRRDYEVSYARIRGLGFQTEVDIHRGMDELIRGLRLVRVRNPYSNV
ncbi:MAG: NAD-dependent epimerase/dehydratase family protein [Myxococcota bacterium]